MKKSENVAGVVSRGFKSYFYFFGIILERRNERKEFFVTLAGIGNRESFGKQIPVLRENAAVMLVLGNVDTEINHGEYSFVRIDTA